MLNSLQMLSYGLIKDSKLRLQQSDLVHTIGYQLEPCTGQVSRHVSAMTHAIGNCFSGAWVMHYPHIPSCQVQGLQDLN